MIGKSQGLFARLGMENYSPELDTTTDVIPASNLSGDDSVQAKLLAAEKDSKPIAAAEDDVVVLANDMETLEHVATALESAIATAGGIRVDSVTFVNLATTPIRKRWGLSTDITPSMEAFADGKRDTATVASLESIQDTIKTIWKALVEKITRMFDLFVDWFRSVTTSTKALREVATNLKTKVKAISGITMPTEQLQIPRLSFTGKQKSSHDFIVAMRTFSNVNDDVLLGHVSKYVDTLVGVACEGLSVRQSLNANSRVTSIDTYNAVVKQLINIEDLLDIKDVVRRESMEVDGLPYLGVTCMSQLELPEGLQLTSDMTVPDFDDATNKAKFEEIDLGKTIGTFVLKITPGQLTPDAVSPPPNLDRESIIDACNMVITTCETIDKFTKGYGERRLALRRLDERVKQLITQAEKDKGLTSEDLASSTRHIRNFGYGMAALYRRLVSFDTQWIKYAMSVADALNRLSTHSLTKTL